MVKILVIGDPHFKVSNTKDTDLMVEKILELAKKVDPDLIVNLGDTLDRHETIHVSPLKRATGFMNQLRQIAYTVLIIGNHDRPNNSVFLTDDHPFNGMKEWANFLVVDKPEQLMLGEHKLLFVPYVPPGRFLEALETMEDWNDPPAKMIFSHQEYLKAKMGIVESEIGDPWPLDKPFTVSGHIHDYDLLQNNLMYLGTPIQQGFGEKGSKWIGIVYLDHEDDTRYGGKISKHPDGIVIERINLGVGNKVTLKVDPNEAMNIQEKVEALVAEGSDVRVIIEGTTSEISSVIKREELKSLALTAKVSYNDVTPENNLDQEGEKKEEERYIGCKFAQRLWITVEETSDKDLIWVYKEIFSK